MIIALKETVVPFLRGKGFSGSFPHFRRFSNNGVDLLTFQFDKWGGGFLIEISKCSNSGFVTHWGETISAKDMRAIDNHPDDRHRIIPGKDGSRESWFRYDGQLKFPFSRVYKITAKSVLSYFDEAEEWWSEYKISD